MMLARFATLLWLSGCVLPLSAPAAAPLEEAVSAIVATGLPAFAVQEIPGRPALRWVVWGGQGEAVRLGLWENGSGTAKQLWSQDWPDAFSPEMRVLPEWRYGDAPVLALVTRYGAAAAQVDIFGLDGQNRPVHMGAQTGAEIAWGVSPAGHLALSVYQASPTRLKPECFGWRSNPAGLVAESCRR